MKKVYMLILVYNGLADLKICLPTLKNFKSKSYSLKTVIIDNASSSKEVKELKKLLKKYPGITLLENSMNLGFAEGNNAGIRYALKNGADYVVLLNNDTVIESDFIENGIKIDAGIVSPVVKFKEFKDKPKFIYDLGGRVNWWTGRTSHINAYRDEYQNSLKADPVDVDYVAGCSMLIKREVFAKIGLLDEKYFIYFEDVDFCITAKKAGFRVVVDPKSTLYHKLGGSMDRWSGRAIYHNLLSNYIFITKHLGVRRLTGYFYLTVLTLKILRDYTISGLKGRSYWLNKKKWRGAKHEYGK